MRPLAVALLCALLGGGAYAKDAEDCIAAAGVAAPDFAMPRVAAAIAKKHLDIAVIGSASSDLAGPYGANIAYPTRLQAAQASKAKKPSQEANEREAALSAEEVLHLRAVQALERIGTKRARQLLQRLAEGAEASPRTRAAVEALRRLEAT